MHKQERIFSNDGYRPNVGIIIHNQEGKVFWGRRIGRDGWQFPQGGVAKNETVEQAMYRELLEETGLHAHQVKVVACTRDWIKYDLPSSLLKNQMKNNRVGRKRFRGQKQIWYLVELLEDDSALNVSDNGFSPEFDGWKWVDAQFALDNIISFKKEVYSKALKELGALLPSPFFID